MRDAPAAHVDEAAVSVTVYTSVGCPFCPIVKERLRALQGDMSFELREMDVTLKTRLRRDKSLRSVPVVEVGNRRLAGNATSQELAAFIGGSADSMPISPESAPLVSPGAEGGGMP